MSSNRTDLTLPAQTLRRIIVAITCPLLMLGYASAQHAATTAYVNTPAVKAAVTRAVVGNPDNEYLAWTGNNCAGYPGLPANEYSSSGTYTFFPTTYTKNVYYSAQSNQLLVPMGTGATATAISATAYSQELGGVFDTTTANANYLGYADGASYCSAITGGQAGLAWLLTPIDPATTLGWTVSGNPLAVAGPLQLP